VCSSDLYRTRLTHSLEAAQIARSVTRELGLDEDLAEALALAHDLGHTPFGHAGEDALSEAMEAHGGFDHNAQTVRILTSLEKRYADFDGLNLTWEMLEGIAKHNGPVTSDPLPVALADYASQHDLELSTHAGPEAQVASLSDDIAYNNHDLDDGLRARLFTIDDLRDIPLVGPLFEEVKAAYPGLDENRQIHEMIRRMIGVMIGDLVGESRRLLSAAAPRNVEEVRALGRPVIGFSEEMRAHDKALKAFLYERMYRHYKVNRMASKARRVVRELFALFLAEPECLPPEWRLLCDGSKTSTTARTVADYIAGMTDRSAFLEHRNLFDVPLK